jgi:molybdate transport system regulatory protein
MSVPVRRRAPRSPQTELLLRFRFDGVKPLLGPGKVELLEQIDSDGSISAASRAMHMSYHRAWTIVNEINAMFREPLVQTQLGGTAGGGAMITPLGRDVVRHYRSIESSVWKHAAEHITALEALTVR